jgi:hypothetical protein
MDIYIDKIPMHYDTVDLNTIDKIMAPRVLVVLYYDILDQFLQRRLYGYGS